jgi:hypothetical protein
MEDEARASDASEERPSSEIDLPAFTNEAPHKNEVPHGPANRLFEIGVGDTPPVPQQRHMRLEAGAPQIPSFTSCCRSAFHSAVAAAWPPVQRNTIGRSDLP